MTLPKINPLKTNSWQDLKNHFEEIKSQTISHFFSNNSKRFKKFSIKANGLLLDYSKNRINDKTLEIFEKLAKEIKLDDAINSYFNGEKINETERRAVLHTAIRNQSDDELIHDGVDIKEKIKIERERIFKFSKEIIAGDYMGFSGKKISTVVNVGIGGSDLGPKMVTEALEFYRNHLHIKFISNIDGDHIHSLLEILDPETTIFILVSKSFTTQETLTNGETIKKWFIEKTNKEAVSKHFVAVSNNLKKTKSFGISSDKIFPMNDWVGGRFSLWSSAGITINLAIGPDNFQELLNGAEEIDNHFKTAEFKNNIPKILAMIGVWYTNFWKADTEAIVPYSEYLRSLPAYLQQSVMESNGKSVNRKGEKINYQTSPIIWGASGTNSQHAFFQHIHQGTKLIPVDFIGFKNSLFKNSEHQKKLLANLIGQVNALMKGKSKDEVGKELASKKMHEDEINFLTPYKVFDGNKPSNTIIFDKVTPRNIGRLIAIYEHKIFVQGIIWNIFSYDQWGVELGKELADEILKKDNKNVSSLENYLFD
ncbi:MAG: glucose-6-phosphate isomerase [Flavobacteriaceae bacterium]|tara:strand:- start:6914 stop:8527 length:1614 start_codon:yes stop_codon:yes gene_type:complete